MENKLEEFTSLLLEKVVVEGFLEMLSREEVQARKSTKKGNVVNKKENDGMVSESGQESDTSDSTLADSTHEQSSGFLSGINELPYDEAVAISKKLGLHTSHEIEETSVDGSDIDSNCSETGASVLQSNSDEICSNVERRNKEDDIIQHDAFQTNPSKDGRYRGVNEEKIPLKAPSREIQRLGAPKKAFESSTPLKPMKPKDAKSSSKNSAEIMEEKLPSKTKLPSNLAIMVGDLSGIDNSLYSSDYDAYQFGSVSSVNLSCHNHEGFTKDEETLQIRPSTLDLSDLEAASVDSYKMISIDRSHQSRGGNKHQFGNGHSNELEELHQCYEREIQRLQLEKEELAAMLRSPSQGTSLLRLRYLEHSKDELERKCHQLESRNRQLTLEVDRLNRACFELERRSRVLETDKTILQERCFKTDQDKRKSDSELSKMKEVFDESLSLRRTLEEEILFLKRKEIESHSRLNNSDMALKELKEELNNSKRDCADKDEVIRSITSQRHEIQENLDEALEQIDRLEEASSQRAREKTLFHKLLEEYETLYKQHHRIRNLYHEAMEKIDDHVEEDVNDSPTKRSLSLKIPSRNNSFRKKWALSPTSPSIREQEEPFAEKESSSAEGKKNYNMSDLLSMNQPNSPRRFHKNDQFNRHSTGSLLSWDTATDHNNNDARFTGDASDTSSPQRCHEYRHSYHNGSFRKDVSDEEENHLTSSGYFARSKNGNSRDRRDWIVQNMDGITRFDVVFSSPKNTHEEPERETPSRDKDSSKSPSDKRVSHSMKSQEAEGEFSRMEDESATIVRLEHDLMKLSAEKNEIESQLRRLPSNGSGRSRRSNAERQELMEERLDEVTKYIGNIRMTLRKHKAL